MKNLMQILFILLPKNKKKTDIWALESQEIWEGYVYTAFFADGPTWRVGEISLVKHHKLQRRKSKQAGIWHVLVIPAIFSNNHSSHPLLWYLKLLEPLCHDSPSADFLCKMTQRWSGQLKRKVNAFSVGICP